MQLVLTTEELEKVNEGSLFLFERQTLMNGRDLTFPPSLFLLLQHDGGWSFPFNVTANFLGFTKIRARKSSPEGEEMSEPLKVSVVKKKTIQSQVKKHLPQAFTTGIYLPIVAGIHRLGGRPGVRGLHQHGLCYGLGKRALHESFPPRR